MPVFCWWMLACGEPEPLRSESVEDSPAADSAGDTGNVDTGEDTAGDTHTGEETGGGDTGPRSDAPYVKVAMYGSYYCGLHSDGVIDCNGEQLRTEIPDVLFTDLVLAGSVACGLDLAGGAHCWGETIDEPDVTEAPEGTYSALSIGFVTMSVAEVCGLAEDGSVTCWGSSEPWRTFDGAPGPYVAMVDGAPACGITAEGLVECWGEYCDSTTNPEWPGLPVKSLSCYGFLSPDCCAIQPDDTLACWHTSANDSLESPPAGAWVSVSVSQPSGACALAVDGTLACWGHPDNDAVEFAPSGTFLAVDAGPAGACAIEPAGTILCWGQYF